MELNEKIESIIEVLTFTKGVVGVVVCNREGIPIRDSFPEVDRSRAIAHAAAAAELTRTAVLLCKAVDGTMMDSIRIRTVHTEFIIKGNEEFLLCVVQEPQE